MITVGDHPVRLDSARRSILSLTTPAIDPSDNRTRDAESPTATLDVEPTSDDSRTDQGSTVGRHARVDPFEGLTDAEVDALSDEYFYGRIEASGIDIDDYFDEELDDGDDFEEPEPIASAAISGDAIDVARLVRPVSQEMDALDLAASWRSPWKCSGLRACKKRPTSSTIADHKVQVLWSYTDLIVLRDQVRSSL